MNRFWIGLLAALALSACDLSGRGKGSSTSAFVPAAQGGTLEVAGARLVIPAGALSQDTTVTLEVKEKPVEPADNPMQPVGSAVRVDLGGASLKQSASLQAPYTPDSQPAYYLYLHTSPDNAKDGGPATYVRPIPGFSLSAVRAQGNPLTLDVPHGGLFTPVAIRQVPTEGGDNPLQVPFYWQSGYAWCSPTSMAMLINYFKPLPGIAGRIGAPTGRVANYTLTDMLDWPAGQTGWVGDFVKNTGVPEHLWSWLRWDPNLMPSAPFTAYAIQLTTGFFGLGPKRPLVATSDRQFHAFVIAGANGNGVFINNGNDRWSGTHPFMTWQQFKNWTCKLKDPNDPSKGCSSEPNEELGTLVIYGEPRPENERRGSIELASSSLNFYDPYGPLLSRSAWDGRYLGGYLFDDAQGLGYIPYDAESGHALPSSTDPLLSFNVVNLTGVSLEYEVLVHLHAGALPSTTRRTLTVGPYNLGRVTPYDGLLSLEELAGHKISGLTSALIEIELRQDGVVQDVKEIRFKATPPTLVPRVTITQPAPNTTVYRGVRVQLSGFAQEGTPSLDVPCERLSWRSSASGDYPGSGCSTSLTFTSNGPRTLTLRATGRQGAIAEASVNVNVVDPPPNLPPVIDEMHIKDASGNEIGDGQRVETMKPLSLSVVAHDPEGDLLSYAWSACQPEWTPLECAGLGDLPTNPDGTSSFDPLQRGFGTWTFYLFVKDGHSVTSRTRTITIAQVIK